MRITEKANFAKVHIFFSNHEENEGKFTLKFLVEKKCRLEIILFLTLP